MTIDTIYDHPLYYDILFGWDRDAEAGFYTSLFATYGVVPGDRVLELACGTGQIARRLARLCSRRDRGRERSSPSETA